MHFKEQFDTESLNRDPPSTTENGEVPRQFDPPPSSSSKTKLVSPASTVLRHRQWLVNKVKALLALHLFYLAFVISFLVVSITRKGIVTIRHWQYVHDGGDSVFFERLSLIWTTIPTLLFSLFLLNMRWCYEEIQRLLPYLQLYKQRDQGKSSVLVNYRAEFPMTAILSSWSRSHKIVSFTITLSVLFSIAAVPLSSHLFETRLRQQSVKADVSGQTVWNSGNLNERNDYSRALQIAGLIDVYKTNGGIFSQWMNDEYAFPTYKSAGEAWPDNSTVSIQGIVGQGGRIDDLKFLNESDYRLSRGNGTNEISLSATDDGCLMELDFDTAGEDVDLYFEIGVAECTKKSKDNSGPSVDTTFSKMFFLIGWPAPDTNATAMSILVITGNPVHTTATGDIKVAIRDDYVSVRNFSMTSNITSKTQTTASFDRAILQSGDSASQFHRFQTNYFGSLILDRFDVARRNATTPWISVDAQTAEELRRDILSAIKKIYSTVYISSASLYGFEAVEWPLDLLSTGVFVTRDVERLFIAEGVAGFLIAILFISLLVAWSAMGHAVEFRDHGVDCPDDIIASYDLIHGCPELREMADDVYSSGQYKGDLVRAANKRWTLRKAIFSIKRDEANGRPKLRVENLSQAN